MSCLGVGTLNEISNYQSEIIYRKNYDLFLIYPEDIQSWYSDLVRSILDIQYKTRKKDLSIAFIIGKTKDEKTGEFYKGATMIGGCNNEKSFITLVVSNRLFANLKMTKPQIATSQSIYTLINYLWHELYHLKGNRGSSEISEEDYHKVLDWYWENCYWSELNDM